MRRPPRLAVAAILFASLAWGIVLAFRIPPFAGTDEAYHWLRVEQISRGGLLAKRLGPNDWGGTIDLRTVKLLGYFGERLGTGAPMSAKDAATVAARLHIEPRDTAIGGFPSSASFAPVAYAPAALATALARRAGADGLGQLHAARLTGVALLVVGVALIASLLPAGGLAAAATLCVPGALGQAATVNADTLNVLLPVLLAAWCLRLRLRPSGRLGRLGKAGLLLLALVIGLLKIVVLPAVAALLLVPRRNFASRAGWLGLVLLGAALSLAVAAVWNARYPFVPGLYWRTGAEPGETLRLLLTTPRHLLATLWTSVLLLPGMLAEAYGRIGAPTQSVRPVVGGLAGLGLTAVLALAFVDRRSGTRALWPAALLAAIALITTTAIALAFRIAYAAPDQDWPKGMQGRYLHGPLVLLGMALALVGPARLPRGTARLATLAVLALQSATIAADLRWRWWDWH